jgi:hypothetical protein
MSSENLMRVGLFMGVGLMVWAVAGIATGNIRGKYSQIVRAESPVMFWFNVLSKLGIGLLVALFAWRLRPASHVDLASLTVTPSQANPEGEACLGQGDCVVVVVAPWCPACESMLGCLGSLGTALPGFSVFITSDSAPRLETMAGKIGKHTFVDAGGGVMHALGIHQFPTWLSMNTRGDVVGRFAGVPHPCTANAVTTLLARH